MLLHTLAAGLVALLCAVGRTCKDAIKGDGPELELKKNTSQIILGKKRSLVCVCVVTSRKGDEQPGCCALHTRRVDSGRPFLHPDVSFSLLRLFRPATDDQYEVGTIRQQRRGWPCSACVKNPENAQPSSAPVPATIGFVLDGWYYQLAYDCHEMLTMAVNPADFSLQPELLLNLDWSTCIKFHLSLDLLGNDRPNLHFPMTQSPKND